MSVNETDKDILISTDTERANLSSPVGNSCPSILINHLLVSCFHSCLLPSPNNFNTALLLTILKDIPFHPSFSLYWLLLILIYPQSYYYSRLTQILSHPRIQPSSDCTYSLCFLIPPAYLFLIGYIIILLIIFSCFIFFCTFQNFCYNLVITL